MSKTKENNTNGFVIQQIADAEWVAELIGDSKLPMSKGEVLDLAFNSGEFIMRRYEENELKMSEFDLTKLNNVNKTEYNVIQIENLLNLIAYVGENTNKEYLLSSFFYYKKNLLKNTKVSIYENKNFDLKGYFKK